MNQASGYNLMAVMHETGLNADTLRAWERRYGLPKPERTSGGHRRYTRRDIQMLNWLSARQKEGVSISQAVDNWRSLESAGQDPLLAFLPHPQQEEMGGVVLQESCQAWVNACMDFNEQAAEQVLAQAFGLFPPEVVCVELIEKGISRIGSEWYAGKTSVQQEHFASALAMRRLYTLFAAAPAPTRPGRILAACPPGEQHEFSLLMLAVLLRRRGWDVVYLGADVPVLRLESTLRAANPFLVISVAQTLPSAASLRRMGEFLASRDIHLAFAGGIIDSQPSMKDRIPGTYLGRTFPDAIETVDNLWNVKPTNPTANPLPTGYQEAIQHYLALQPKIEVFLKDSLHAGDIPPEHLDIAIIALRQHVEAALELGDIRLVENSFAWLNSLFVNHGVPVELLKRFFVVYRQALDIHLSDADKIVFSSLIDTFKDY